MEKFQVSARKYRPIQFTDVVGQAHITTTLQNAIRNEQVAQSFLFCGPRGVGKTTCARILAKVLNCENLSDNFEPCNTCASCTAFNDNASFNIFELDAASNNSVEDIRSLIDQVRFAPQSGQYKVYIIDEVHMLSQSAFNAFLKTLEEPPPYAIFIMATTEKHKILPTILSRCQIFDFKRIGVQDIVGHLKQICQQEQIEAAEQALHVIGQKADGALRDALSIFDRINSFSNGIITYDAVINTLNILDYDYYFQVIDAIMVQDQTQLLLLLDKIIQKGFDGGQFLEGLAQHLRDLLVAQDKQTAVLLEYSKEVQQRYVAQSQLISSGFVLSALNIINQFSLAYRSSQNKRLQVELALLKILHINSVLNLDKIVQKAPTVVKPKEKKTPEITESKANYQQNITQPIIEKKPKPSPTPSVPQLGKPGKLKTLNFKNGNNSRFSLEALDKIEEEKAAQLAGKKTAEEAGLTQEILVQHWMAFKEQLESNRVKSAFRNYQPVLVGHNQIKVLVPGSMEEAIFKEEGNQFIKELSNILNIYDLEFNIEVNKTLAPKEDKQLLTSKDKFKDMVQRNPILIDLQKTLQLELIY